MKKKTKKTSVGNQPIGQLRSITDFLPPPEKLVTAEETVKVTLSLDRHSLEFFRTTAERLGGKYQRMMREVLRGYAQRYAGRRG